MRKLFIFVSLLICLITGMVSTPVYSSVEAATSQSSNIQVQNLADETNPADLDWLTIEDYSFTHLNTAKSNATGYAPFGNSTYLFNLPFELSSEYEVSQVEIDYMACSKWFLGIVGGICTGHTFVQGAVSDYESDLTYFQGSWSTGIGWKLFDYDLYKIKELGKTVDLINVSQEIGPLHSTSDYTDFLAYRLGSDSTYDNLLNYEYYFSLNTNINWDTVIIRVQFKQVSTGEIVDVPCGENGQGCEVIGDPEPVLPNMFQKIIDWLSKTTLGISNILIAIGGIMLLILFVNVLKMLVVIPKAIWWVIKMLFKLFKFIAIAIKKIVKTGLKFIKWVIVRLWKLLGLILRGIGKLYMKITHYFTRRSQRKLLRNRGG